MGDKHRTIGSTALSNRGATTGFDYLRLGLALSIVTYHALTLSSDFWSQWYASHRPVLAILLPAFFALSGFLVTGSLLRNSIPEFMALRALRLVPALAVEVFLSAILVGGAFTTLPLRDYFSTSEFWMYFLNIIGEIHFFLPGVFDGNPVNSQLWTIPYELKCYAMLICAALLTRFGFQKFLPVTVLLLSIALTVWVTYTGDHWSDWHPSGRVLVVAFLWACTIYLYQDILPYRAWLACAALVLSVAFLCYPRFEALAALPIAYLTIYIGLKRLPKIPFGDLSYGIFLFHLPILQIFRLELHVANPWALLGLVIFSSGLFALASWNFIESPILARKKQILDALSTMATARPIKNIETGSR